MKSKDINRMCDNLCRVELTEKSMFFLSWLTARGSGTGSVCLMTETDSPTKTAEGSRLNRFAFVSADDHKNKAQPIISTERDLWCWSFMLPHWSFTCSWMFHFRSKCANWKQCHDTPLGSFSNDLVHWHAAILVLQTQVEDWSTNLGRGYPE